MEWWSMGVLEADAGQYSSSRASAPVPGGHSGLPNFGLAIVGHIGYGERVELNRHPRVPNNN